MNIRCSAFSVHAGLFIIMMTFLSCKSDQGASESKQNSEPYVHSGEIIVHHDAMADIIDPGAPIEIIATGYEWSEGPLWVPSENKLIWSDVPNNTVYEWTEKGGVRVYLSPSGYTGMDDRAGASGSNGLLLNREGQLVLCQHGDRRLAEMKAPVSDPRPEFRTISDNYNGAKFNSPNDVAQDPSGAYYFTDPPYGLPGGSNDPGRDLDFQGIFKVSPNGEVKLLEKDLSRPNGIAFSPGFNYAYVSNSDPDKAIWMKYELDGAGDFQNGSVFFDATTLTATQKGLPDGLKVNDNGILFCSGPGGVLVFSPEGHHLGTISTGEAVSNCALGDGYLFMTSDMHIARVRLK